jgi:hypothetical protein
MNSIIKPIKKKLPIVKLKNKISKSPSKAKDEFEGVKLVGDPDKLIRLMITDLSKARKVKNQIINEGPKHKQVLSALLFKRIYKLVKIIENNCNTKFTLQKGSEIILENEGKKTLVPILFPIHLNEKFDSKKVIEAISHAPEHEVLAYGMSLQAIEWVIKLAGKK